MNGMNGLNDDEPDDIFGEVPFVDEEFDHDRLEEELRQAAAILDPVPAELRRAAIEAYALHDLDARIAELTFDSLVDAIPVRGAVDVPRMLTFHTGGLTVDVEVTDEGLMGQLLPPQSASIEVLHGPVPAPRSPPTTWAASPATRLPAARSPSGCGPTRRSS